LAAHVDLQPGRCKAEQWPVKHVQDMTAGVRSRQQTLFHNCRLLQG
jgi:hypothetical protein